MNRCGSLPVALTALLLICAPANAQERPADSSPSIAKTEVFIGVGGVRGLGDDESGWASGGRFGIDMNLSDRVAIVFTPSLGVGVSTANGSWLEYAFLAGPRVRFGTQKRVMPFAQILAGVGRGPANSNMTSSFPPEQATAFLLSLAGGADVALTPRFAWRVIQLEERSHIGDLMGNHYVAVSTGVVIRFGARK